MLKLIALLTKQSKLRDGRVEHRLLLGNVKAGSRAAGVAVVDDLQSLLFEINGFGDHRHFSVEFAQLKKIAGQLRTHGQADVLQIRGRRLIRSIRGLNAPAHASEQINLIIQIEWNLVIALSNGSKLCRGADQQCAISRKALTLPRNPCAQVRI